MIGKVINQLRNASQDFRDEVMKIESEVKDDIRSAARDAIDPGKDEETEDLDGGGQVE